MKTVQLTVVEIDAPRRWECDDCGFSNAPHVNRRTPDQHAYCEQCGKLAAAITADTFKARGAGQEVRYA